MLVWSVTGSAAVVAEYRGHTDSVAALAAGPGGDCFASGGWDGALHVWGTGASTVKAAEEAAADGASGGAKKRKGDGNGASVSTTAPLQVRSCAGAFQHNTLPWCGPHPN